MGNGRIRSEFRPINLFFYEFWLLKLRAKNEINLKPQEHLKTMFKNRNGSMHQFRQKYQTRHLQCAN